MTLADMCSKCKHRTEYCQEHPICNLFTSVGKESLDIVSIMSEFHKGRYTKQELQDLAEFAQEWLVRRYVWEEEVDANEKV